MDEPHELAQRLCVMVGTMMEDASAIAVTVTNDSAGLRAKIAQLQAVTEICAELLPIALRLTRVEL